MAGKKQTAVEWLEVEFNKYYAFSREEMQTFNRIFNQSKQLEKEQMEDLFDVGCLNVIDTYEKMQKGEVFNLIKFEQYYNETYGKDKSET
jgi:hypothetical protein